MAKNYKVALGKSIVSRKGILEEGAPISADTLAGGQSSIDHLVKKGYIVEAEAAKKTESKKADGEKEAEAAKKIEA